MTENRKYLSMCEKNLILEETMRNKEAEVTSSGAALALWEKQNIKFDHVRSQSLVIRIFCHEDEIRKAAADHNLKTKRTRQSAAPRI